MKKTFRNILFLGFCSISLLAAVSCQSTNIVDDDDYGSSKAPVKSAMKEKLENMRITIISSPKETTKGKDFSEPYKIKVTTLYGLPYPELELVVEYPSERNENFVSFGKAKLITDTNGAAEFTPPTPTFAAKSKVTFYPQISSVDSSLKRLCEKVKVSADWNVRTDAKLRTGILVSIVDYNEEGKLIVGSGSQPSTQALTQVLWKGGLMGAQNADFSKAIDSNDTTKIQEDARRLLHGNSTFRYVVFGKVKYAEKITKDESDVYTVTLTGDVNVLDIETGEVLLKEEKSATASDKSQWNVIKLAQEAMAKEFGEAIIYGL